MKNYKKIILCADDYGQKASISQAILELIIAKRLSAISCMVTKQDWLSQGAMLLVHKDQVEVGLHFNLTEGASLSGKVKFRPLINLLLSSLVRQIDKDMIKAELMAQVDAFTQVFGVLPVFIDGHQHIQHFPVVRDALLEVYLERFNNTGCYIRCVADPRCFKVAGSRARFKRIVLELSGASVFRRMLKEQNIPYNMSFSGVYPFNNATQYAKYFPEFLAEITNGGLILCHPGFDDADPKDAIANARLHEFNYLRSDLFLSDCKNAKVDLSRFSDFFV